MFFCSKASLGTLRSQKTKIICWLWLEKSYFLLVFKALCKCMADNLWIFPPGFAEEVPFLQANISWWSKRMQPQLLKCVYLPTTLLLINIYYIGSYQIKTRRNLNNNSPIMGIHKKEFFTFFLLPLTVRIEQKKLCSVTSFEFKKKNQNSFW